MTEFLIDVSKTNRPPLPISFYSGCASYRQKPIARRKGQTEFHQILFVLAGTGTLFCEREYPLSPGAAFFSAAGTPLSYGGSEDFVTAFLTVRGDAVRQMAAHFGISSLFFRSKTDLSLWLDRLHRILAEYKGQRRDAPLSSLLYSFFADFLSPTEPEENTLSKRVRLYVENHFSESLSLSSIAAHFHISTSKLCHDFKRDFGTSVGEYLLEYRLSYARSLLLSENERLQAISFACGFDDPAYFGKAFRRRFGVSPGTFRKTHLSFDREELVHGSK